MPSTTAFTITASMLEPLTDAIMSNLGVVLPIALGIMGVMIGVRLIPRIIHTFF